MLRSRILLVFLFIGGLPLLLTAQHRQSIDLVGGLEYSFRSLFADAQDPTIALVLATRDEEYGKFNWRFGVNYNRRLSDRLFLRTGLRLASVGYQRSNYELRWGTQHDGLGGFDPDAGPDLPGEIKLITDYWFVEIPLVARYELGQGRLRPFFELGIAPSIYVTSRNKSILDGESSVHFQRQKGLSEIQLVSIVAAGVNYQLNDNLQLFGQPTFRYHLTAMANAPIKEQLYNYGLELGLRKIID